MSHKMVYVCMGSTGEYSNHLEWPVKAFLDEQRCHEFVVQVSAEYRKIKLLYQSSSEKYTGNIGEWIPFIFLQEHTNPLDPNMTTDYTGTNYYMMPVPLEENT